MLKDHYKVLGISKNSNIKEIKKSFKKLVGEYHPDKNGGKESEKFKEINEAYEILSDERKRVFYDQQMYKLTPEFKNKVWEDILKPFSQSVRNHHHQTSVVEVGGDVTTSLVISFIESFNGTKKEILVKSTESCTSCSGSGSTPGARTINCGTCGGTGFMNDLYDLFSANRKCFSCHGRKTRPLSPCFSCMGSGSVLTDQKILVSIPSGVNTGDTLRVSGKGDPGDPPGDLYISIHVESHPTLTRKDDDILMTLQVPIENFILGGSLNITTPWGVEHSINLQPNTESGSIYVIKGAGFKKRNSTGDALFKLNVSLPKVLTEETRKAFSHFIEVTKQQ